VSLTPNPVSSRSDSDANMTLSSEDLFGHQRQTWASCPNWVQKMILKNIRQTIKAKMQQEHRVREDRREEFTDDWAAVAEEVQSQISSRAHTGATPRIQSQTPSNLGIEAMAAPPGNQLDSEETVSYFNFGQTATPLWRFLDSDPHTPDGSPEVAMGLTVDNTVTPTTLRQLVLSIEDLESQEEAAVHSEPSDMEQGQGGSNDACR